MKLPNVAEGLRAMQQKRVRLTPLLHLLVPALAQHLHSHSNCSLLTELAQHVALGSPASLAYYSVGARQRPC